MPKVKTVAPRVSREKGQRSLDMPDALFRILPPWSNPSKFLQANTWRNIVANQPTAVVCREALISSYLSLEWKIEPKDSERRDELKEEIDYHTNFFENTGKYSYDEIVEWIGKDILDIPFGAGAEVGRAGDRPEGRVMWLELLDGGTLFPYPNNDWPVGQYIREAGMTTPIFFPKHAINRVYYSPETYIKMEGWGIAPPQKIYLALELLNRGDKYYANLLLDTPEAGILDLGDMAEKAAKEWVEAFRTMLGGIDPLKIPVLYEHNNDVNFIPFGKPPTDLMFDRVTAKYASIVTAGYGLTLSDIGIQTTTSGGDTLAGSIRDERKTRRTGFARFKRKMVSFFNFMLPDTLYYKVIDQDDELSVARARTRLADATAFAQLIESGVFSPQETRLQMIADGTITISVPEKIPEDEFPEPEMGVSDERPGLLGRPIAPSQGGHGEVLPRGDVFSDEVARMINVPSIHLRRAIRSVIKPVEIEANDALEKLSDAELQAWDDWHDDAIWGDLEEELPELTLSTLSLSRAKLRKLFETERWWELSVSEDELYDDFIDLFVDVTEKELGEEINEELEGKYKSGLAEILEHINKSTLKSVQNCVISGTKKALIDKQLNAKSLDEDEIISDNRTVGYVRQELLHLENKIISKFAVQLSEMIKKTLGDL